MRRTAAQTHAKQHTQRHRAKVAGGKDAQLVAKAIGIDRKESVAKRAVFRPILTSPFALQWPRIAKPDAEMLLHALVEQLTQVPDSQSRIHGVSVGLNIVTKLLESHIDSKRESGTETKATGAQPRFLFVCEGDSLSPALLAHIPMLVASYNAMCAPTAENIPVVLIPFAPGAELLLSTALHVRRASVILMHTDAQASIALEHRIGAVIGTEMLTRGFRAKWLDQCSSAQKHTLQPVHIKHVASSTPINLAESKQKKKQSRKEHHRQRKQILTNRRATT
ncbi:ribonuclease P [Malassezia yamatoensis]|uniref:Ribonuclease P n=1 Tax=Malassezia yamatoensis TaxID=253288 RepID=A0AAJ5YU95_9BASI|nr:ribonuclease P [Malassezia yamatoensis]